MSRTAIRLRRVIRSAWTLPALVLLAFALLPLPALHLLGTVSDTLADKPQWEVSKVRAEGQLMGSAKYRDMPQAMAGEHLNLEAWHGCQEVLSAASIQPARLQFRFRYAPNGFLSLRFGVGAKRGYALRVSNDPHHPGGFFDVAYTGEFLHRLALPALDCAPDRWHTLELRLDSDGGTVLIDEAPAGSLPGPLVLPGKVGFWGGWQPAAVDDFEVFDAQDAVLVDEAFTHQFRWNPLAAGALLLVAALAALVYAFGRWRGVGQHEALAYVLSLLLCTASAAYTYLAARPYLAALYPKAEVLAARERSWFDGLLERRDERIMATGAERTAGVALRLMFVGTSQTYGMGAMLQVNSFVPLLHDKFADAPFPSGRVECINAAVPGANTTLLFSHFVDRWLTLKPDIVVFNFGCNDPATSEFETNLRNMALAARRAGAEVIFMKEPTARGMVDQIDWKYAAIARVATSLKAPLIDAQAYMLSVEDSGFLWWDMVHPTDYGHRLMADYLYPILRDAAGARIAAQ